MKRMDEEVGCVKKKNMFARLALSPAIVRGRPYQVVGIISLCVSFLLAYDSYHRPLCDC